MGATTEIGRDFHFVVRGQTGRLRCGAEWGREAGWDGRVVQNGGWVGTAAVLCRMGADGRVENGRDEGGREGREGKGREGKEREGKGRMEGRKVPAMGRSSLRTPALRA